MAAFVGRSVKYPNIVASLTLFFQAKTFCGPEQSKPDSGGKVKVHIKYLRREVTKSALAFLPCNEEASFSKDDDLAFTLVKHTKDPVEVEMVDWNSDLKCLPRILLSDMSPNLDRFVAITCEWPQLQNRGLTHMNTYYIRVTDIVGSSVTGYETRYFPAIHHHLRPCLVQCLYAPHVPEKTLTLTVVLNDIKAMFEPSEGSDYYIQLFADVPGLLPVVPVSKLLHLAKSSEVKDKTTPVTFELNTNPSTLFALGCCFRVDLRCIKPEGAHTPPRSRAPPLEIEGKGDYPSKRSEIKRVKDVWKKKRPSDEKANKIHCKVRVDLDSFTAYDKVDHCRQKKQYIVAKMWDKNALDRGRISWPEQKEGLFTAVYSRDKDEGSSTVTVKWDKPTSPSENGSTSTPKWQGHIAIDCSASTACANDDANLHRRPYPTGIQGKEGSLSPMEVVSLRLAKMIDDFSSSSKRVDMNHTKGPTTFLHTYGALQTTSSVEHGNLNKVCKPVYTIQLPCTEGFLTASDMKILASRLYPDDAMRATTFSSGSTGDVTTVRAALSERLSLLTSEMTISSHTSGNKLLPLGNPASSALSTALSAIADCSSSIPSSPSATAHTSMCLGFILTDGVFADADLNLGTFITNQFDKFCTEDKDKPSIKNAFNVLLSQFSAEDTLEERKEVKDQVDLISTAGKHQLKVKELGWVKTRLLKRLAIFINELKDVHGAGITQWEGMLKTMEQHYKEVTAMSITGDGTNSATVEKALRDRVDAVDSAISEYKQALEAKAETPTTKLEMLKYLLNRVEVEVSSERLPMQRMEDIGMGLTRISAETIVTAGNCPLHVNDMYKRLGGSLPKEKNSAVKPLLPLGVVFIVVISTPSRRAPPLALRELYRTVNQINSCLLSAITEQDSLEILASLSLANKTPYLTLPIPLLEVIHVDVGSPTKIDRAAASLMTEGYTVDQAVEVMKKILDNVDYSIDSTVGRV